MSTSASASAHAHAHGLIICLTFLSIFLLNVTEANGVAVPMKESKRKLASFQLCALCTCCGGAKGLCLPSPCCYAINCNIPNRPFGFCSFTPKACNCFGCQL